ncbi:hypothetical protein MNBD_GAMMA26-2019 [hydrothermal vent metagenome]|uniref:Addiction module antitoxin RelB n=1 Tax=hydrothermal vent metagenome TaxID=652676 RepID=A0A3B1AM79_9ZZZZ
MAIILPLEKMSIEEKIGTMESIWNDLCRMDDCSILSPSWHKEILDEREENIKQGKDHFIDWSTAKEKIRKNIS